MDNILLIFGLILGVLLVSTRGQEQECQEQQFSQTRINYETCASKKIHEITSWLQREELEGEVKEEGVTAVCMAVRQLIHDCGNALSFCFSDGQVEETKQKQRAGLQTILAKHYSQENMEKCFLRDPEPNPSKSVTEPSATATTNPKQDKEILRNIEALIEFTTPTSTISVSKSFFTTPVITTITTKTTTSRTTTSTTKTPTTTTIVVSKSTFTTTVTSTSQKTTTTETTITTSFQTTTAPKTTSRTPTTSSTITEITTNPPQTTTPKTKNSDTSTPLTSSTTPQTKSQQTQITLREKIVSSATTTTISTLVSSTTTTISTLPTKTSYHDFDVGTTHSPVEPFKCEEKEFTETRDNYERCASNKIREITAWLERKERRRRRRTAEEEDSSILTVCNAVRQLLYDCGNELGWCFTEDQVSETRFKQREGLETILSKHYTPEKLEMCFMQENTPELVNIIQVLDNQTEKNAVSGATGSKHNVTIEDISENIISDSSDSGDRHPRVFPSTKQSSTSRVKTLSFLHFFILIILVATFT